MLVSRSPTRKRRNRPLTVDTRSSASVTPQEGLSSSVSEQHSMNSEHPSPDVVSQGAVAAAIQSLPIDVGTVVSPTVTGTSKNTGAVCKGGPGNLACNLEVTGKEGVQCDICMGWYHLLCQDITRAAYNAMNRHRDVTAFICSMCKKLPNLEKFNPRPILKDASTQSSTECHSQKEPNMVHSSVQVGATLCGAPPGDSNDQTLSELVKKVNSLESIITEHMTGILSHLKATSGSNPLSGDNSEKLSYAEALTKTGIPDQTQHMPTQTSNPRRQTTQSHSQDSHSQDYRGMVREELLELEERKKRRASLVIRGLRAVSPAEAATKFAEVAQALIGERVTISEVCRIRKDADLYRGNVHCVRQRQVILEQAKNLKDSSFSHVYIKRDLTYMQRQQLQERYRQRQVEKIPIRPATRDNQRPVHEAGVAIPRPREPGQVGDAVDSQAPGDTPGHTAETRGDIPDENSSVGTEPGTTTSSRPVHEAGAEVSRPREPGHAEDMVEAQSPGNTPGHTAETSGNRRGGHSSVEAEPSAAAGSGPVCEAGSAAPCPQEPGHAKDMDDAPASQARSGN